jgi:hypothetical protein
MCDFVDDDDAFAYTAACFCTFKFRFGLLHDFLTLKIGE